MMLAWYPYLPPLVLWKAGSFYVKALHLQKLSFKQKGKAKVKEIKHKLKDVGGKMKAGFSKLLRLCN